MKLIFKFGIGWGIFAGFSGTLMGKLLYDVLDKFDESSMCNSILSVWISFLFFLSAYGAYEVNKNITGRMTTHNGLIDKALSAMKGSEGEKDLRRISSWTLMYFFLGFVVFIFNKYVFL